MLSKLCEVFYQSRLISASGGILSEVLCSSQGGSLLADRFALVLLGSSLSGFRSVSSAFGKEVLYLFISTGEPLMLIFREVDPYLLCSARLMSLVPLAVNPWAIPVLLLYHCCSRDVVP